MLFLKLIDSVVEQKMNMNANRVLLPSKAIKPVKESTTTVKIALHQFSNR